MANSRFLRDSMLQLSIPTRDSDYYIYDGNTVLLVQNTLFRVHRSTLTKDNSTFDTMFSLPADVSSSSSESSMTVSLEGETDDNPIRLQGDTAEEFRALLWALYALPNELMIAMTNNANCTQLVHIARLAHKYQFRSIEQWASSALSRYYSRPGAFDGLCTTFSDNEEITRSPSLTQLTEVAALCENQELLDASIVKWRKLVSEGRDVACAIAIAESLNIRSLIGLSYHAMMLTGRSHWDTEPLTRNQRVRLLAGHYSLCKLWETMPSQPPALTHTSRCTSQQRCTKTWGNLWRIVLETGTQVLSLQTVDVVRKLVVAESCVKAFVGGDIQSQGMLEGMHHCKDNAIAATSAKLQEVRESLADHFTNDI